MKKKETEVRSQESEYGSRHAAVCFILTSDF